MNIREELKKILDEYFGLVDSNVFDQAVKRDATNAILSLISSHEKELIGEDEEVYPSYIEEPIRNDFRAEMRAKLKGEGELHKEGKEENG